VVLLSTQILVLLPSAIPLSLDSICFLHSQLQIPHLFYLLPTEKILVLHWGLSFHTFSLGMCILFFFLGTELKTTSPTTNQCCDTHSSPAMTLMFFFISSVTSLQQQVINCTHCTTRNIGGQFVLLSLETNETNNQFLVIRISIL